MDNSRHFIRLGRSHGVLGTYAVGACFLAMQLVFFSFVAKRKDVKTAFLTSILLLSSFEVHRAAVACRLDMLQVSLIVISLCLLFRWDEKNCKGIPWLAVLLMACATLTKGPVGSIFPCLGIGVYQLLRRRSFGKLSFHCWASGYCPSSLWAFGFGQLISKAERRLSI